MFNFIQAVPKFYFEDIILPNYNTEDLYISILDPISTPVLKDDCENYKSFWFYDLPFEVGNFKFPSDEVMNSLFDFIDSNSKRRKVYIHCTGGVARSGAVAKFIFDYFGSCFYKIEEFNESNSNIDPNDYVYNKLSEIYNIKKAEV